MSLCLLCEQKKVNLPFLLFIGIKMNYFLVKLFMMSLQLFVWPAGHISSLHSKLCCRPHHCLVDYGATATTSSSPQTCSLNTLDGMQSPSGVELFCENGYKLLY
ncbi:hypothetical protein GOODEAATRI_011585 [Goodea atripinnis]|uniref:Uncharacterized protein n=1 Tax=Goodea atripinnis TaxID=208336 RepID=A0ABV0N0J0_9TELE